MPELPRRRPSTDADPVSAYAWDVLKGHIIAGRLVRLSCERHFRDLVHGPGRGLTWRPDIAKHAIEFTKFMRHSKGEWAGRRLDLAPWQQFVRGSAFGWMRADGYRRFRVVFEEVARKNGKLLRDDTPVPTPRGWTCHGDLRSGDLVFNPLGQPVRVLATTESYAGPCYRVGFSDGASIIAHARHEWRTERTAHTGRPHGSRKPLPELETQQIAATLRHSARGDLTHGIPAALALDTGPDINLPLPPYTLGIWLGDGTSAGPQITSADREVIAGIEADGVAIAPELGATLRYTLADTVPLGLFEPAGRPAMQIGFRGRLHELGILDDKAVPAMYLRASIRQRRELLAGLVDSDGHVTPRGQCEVVLTNRKLFLGLVELTRTLGFKPTVVEDRATLKGRDIGPRYRMQFWPSRAELPLRIPRKRDRLLSRPFGRSRRRMIVSCDPVGEHVGKCITVEGGMYLAGEGMVPTHNSTDAASVALHGLVADGEPGADVYSAATKKDQARIVFDEARKMVLRSPALMKKVRPFRLSLAVDSTMSSFQPLSADEHTLDGLNPHFVVIDELHKHKTRGVLDVLDTALGARRQPLLWIITTAGDDNPESVYAQEHAYAQSVAEGSYMDDAWFVYIATLDKEDAWDNPKVWIKANPNLGISVKLDDLDRMARAARGSPQKQSEFKRLRLNMRQASAQQKITGELWDRNSLGPFDPAEMIGRRCLGGLDLASKIDIGAWVKLFPPLPDETVAIVRGGTEIIVPARWRVVCRFWIPADTVEEKSSRDRVQYQRWIDEGWIEATPGNVIDHNEIQAAILEDQRQHELVSVAFDPWNALQLAVNLESHGIPTFQFVQGLRSYNAPTKELDALLADDRLDHGDNPVLKWMALNMRVQTDKNNNEMPTKKHSIGRIDGMSSLIMAIGRSMEESPSVYEERGLESF